MPLIQQNVWTQIIQSQKLMLKLWTYAYLLPESGQTVKCRITFMKNNCASKYPESHRWEKNLFLLSSLNFHSNLQSIEHFFSLTLFLKISNYMRF